MGLSESLRLFIREGEIMEYIEIPTRDFAILINRFKGWTYQEIGDKYGITRQRVEQIITQYVFPEDIKPKPRNLPHITKCLECGVSFIPKKRGQKFHDTNCRVKNWRTKQQGESIGA